jgi:iron complex transport system substrate-binding protein
MTRAAPRIVSLLASGTELVCALGLGEWLIGRSHECDHPAWVTRLPAVSHPSFDITGSSREIDERVRERLRAGQPLYEVDDALLLQLSPDVLITQTHCEVCAVSPADFTRQLAPKLERKQVLTLSGGTLSAILQDFVDVATVLGRPEAGKALVEAIRARLDELARTTRALPHHPSLVCLEWIEPPFAMGNWGPELVELAGGTNLLGQAGAHSTTTPWSALREADPEVLVIAPCGFGIERTLGEVARLEQQPGWQELRAVRNEQVYVADGNLYFNRSGPSLFETPQILAEILHPSVLSPAHRGRAWRRWPIDR